MESQWVLIDTSILIEFVRVKDKTQTLLFKLSQTSSLAISVISEYEFLNGRTQRNAQRIDELLSHFRRLDFDHQCAEIASNLYQDLKKRNALIDAPDIFIAATALAHRLPLATLNQKHFKRFQSLNLLSLP